MIRKQKQLFYFVGDVPYTSLEEAQKADLKAMLPPDNGPMGLNNDCIADWLLKNKDAIVDTLLTTPRSRLRARKLHGGTKKRKSNNLEQERPEKKPQ